MFSGTTDNRDRWTKRGARRMVEAREVLAPFSAKDSKQVSGRRVDTNKFAYLRDNPSCRVAWPIKMNYLFLQIEVGGLAMRAEEFRFFAPNRPADCLNGSLQRLTETLKAAERKLRERRDVVNGRACNTYLAEQATTNPLVP